LDALYEPFKHLPVGIEGAYLSFLVSRKVGSKWIEKEGGHRVLKLKDSLEQKALSLCFW